MPKAKKSSKRMRFDYNKDRKKMKKKFLKKDNPRIEHPHIRNAWDERKSMARNLQDMGLSFDPNQTLPVKPHKVQNHKESWAGRPLVTKPYIINQLEVEASVPEKDTKTLSSDLIEYVQHMVREHGQNHKAMARDEKNYYQDTPKQIKRKIIEYKRCHPQHYDDFIQSLANAAASSSEPMVQ